ncbi:MAG: hypothetical protein M1819_004702 [Sarea resinae]|nr:MAG: hypothetical protein M1819_004702 [Sarea resinae]
MALVGNVGINYDRESHLQGTGHDGNAFIPRHDPYSADSSTLASGATANQRRSDSSYSEAKQGGVLEEKDGEYEEPEFDPDSRATRQVSRLARQLTQQSGASGQWTNPFTGEKDSALDPNSPNFSAKAWVKALLKLQSRDPDLFPERTAGIAYKNLNVHGYGTPTDYQKDVGNVLLEGPAVIRKMLGLGQTKIQILRNFEGLVHSGEMLVVLGRPGSGCSTLLKTIAGETHGIYVDSESYINYQGISAKQMHSQFRGEAIYTAETDVHFPQLSVGDTLSFAAQARAPRSLPEGVSKKQYASHLRDVVMAMFGLGHTINTRVGNDYIRGVSGGERKRVSIAEAALCGSPLQCWDNSTRGLDSANALEFCRTLKMSTESLGATACVAIYQASQSAYDVFDKVVLLYEGRQIYFGRTTDAKEFFTTMGFHCPDRQTTADFLTSLTSATERVVKPGWEDRVPRTPDEFAEAWKKSETHAQLMRDIESYEKQYPIGGEQLQKFIASRRAQQAKRQRVKSPYTLSFGQQIRLCVVRGFQRLRGDPSLTFTALFGNFAMSLIVGSVFYNMPHTTASFFQRGSLLFFAVLLNAFSSALEILTLYAQRPIVEKQARYALYHPSVEAIASMLCDMPYKITNAFTFNLPLYFLTNLRREPGPFFFYVLISFASTMVMSQVFRTIGSASRSISEAMAPAAILILALVIYTGFVLPTRNMLGWSRWINYLNPLAYSFESLMVNEFHKRTFDCAAFVPSGPGYETVTGLSRACSVAGAVAGSPTVNGDAYINASFEYYQAHKWRNFGILIGYFLFLTFTYLSATEFIQAKKSKGEVLLFRRGHAPASVKAAAKSGDIEATAELPVVAEKGNGSDDAIAVIQKQTAIFHWQDVCYDIKIKGEPRRLLDHVDGWVKPGTLTALMGVSGAGKTTLLDVLATRVTMGVVTGEMLVDGRQRDDSFQRKTGYVQQQDLHLSTSTVREALNFSAVLRQPAHVSRKEKMDYVNEVIKLLEMEEYADAVVGVPGEGLNVEQRKRLTIGVELAAKPQLLLFLDEPTSGLDSQTSWSICDLMEKLTNHGQAILCTIHQPSAMLFQRFDRLLFLARGGRTVYFGEVGENSKILTNYFESNGAPPCPPEANPAEWMLEIIGAAPGSHSDINWPETWNNSPERTEVRNELARMKTDLPLHKTVSAPADKTTLSEFAAPMTVQVYECTQRVFQQYWRTPSYIYSKFALCLSTSLFVGFSFFKAKNSQQGLQNQMFSIFMLMTIFGNLVQQIMPHFVTQRALYEVRERPSKAYSWKAFMLCNILVELPWNSLMAVVMFLCWYYPIGLYRNAEPTGAVHERGALMFLLIWTFMLFTSTFTNMIIAGIETAETGGNIANLLFSLTLIFCGVIAAPGTFPGFWIFMYRVSPFTYLVSAMLSTAVANTKVVCSSIEYRHFNPPNGSTCAKYLSEYISTNGGYVTNPSATSDCQFCAISSTNTFLASINAHYSQRWRNFGFMWIYIIFNICAAVAIYWVARVPKKSAKSKTE